jgi:hypothetical protein
MGVVQAGRALSGGVVGRYAPKFPGVAMDKFTSDNLTSVFVAPLLLGTGVEGQPLLASGGRNGAVLKCDLYGGDAVGGSLIGSIELSGLTQPPPDAALSGCDRSWGANFSSMPRRRVRSCCVIRQLTGANVSDAGVPA